MALAATVRRWGIWLGPTLPRDLRDKVLDYKEISKDDLLRWHQILARKGWVAPEEADEFVRLANSL